MDLSKILAELGLEREQIEEAVASLQKHQQGKKRPARPPFSPAPASAAATVGNVPYGRKRVDSTSYYPSSNARPSTP
jgi:hypothetical protein